MESQYENQILVSRIKDLCASVGISIRQLEIALHYPNATIAKWATAATRPPFERLSSVAQYFGVTISFLRGESETPGDGDGLSGKARLIALLCEQVEPWLQDQIAALLKAAIANQEGKK